MSMSIRNYWKLSYETKDYSEPEYEQYLLHFLDKSIHEQLISDVPVGLLLSGGIDSSAIASFAAKYQPNVSFSIGFNDSKRDKRLMHLYLLISYRYPILSAT